MYSRIILFLLILLTLIPSFATAKGYDFTFAQLKYKGEWDPYQYDTDTIISSISKYTSIDINPEPVILTLSDKRIFEHPFLYMAGCGTFPDISQEEADTLRRYLIYGGLLFVDNCAGTHGLTFDTGFRREMKKVFPEFEVARLDPDHVVYISFFILKNVGGRRISRPYLEGITIGDWTPVVYTENDIGGALEKDRFGRFKFNCEPGGEKQRQMAIRTAINIVLYALTVDYKKDQVHIPFILKRIR